MRLLNSPVHGQAQGLFAQKADHVQVGVKFRVGENEDHVAVEQGVDGGDGPGQAVMTHLGHFLGLLPGQAGVGGDDPQGGVGVGIWLADNTLWRMEAAVSANSRLSGATRAPAMICAGGVIPDVPKGVDHHQGAHQQTVRAGQADAAQAAFHGLINSE